MQYKHLVFFAGQLSIFKYLSNVCKKINVCLYQVPPFNHKLESEKNIFMESGGRPRWGWT